MAKFCASVFCAKCKTGVKSQVTLVNRKYLKDADLFLKFNDENEITGYEVVNVKRIYKIDEWNEEKRLRRQRGQ